MIYLLDTDHNTVIQREGAGIITLRERLRELSPDDYGTSIVSYEEQCKGWTDLINRAKNSETRVVAYARLKEHLRFYTRIAVWGYDMAADEVYMRLIKAKVRVGTKDLRIASIAIAKGATLLTKNVGDFTYVPNLTFADWTS